MTEGTTPTTTTVVTPAEYNGHSGQLSLGASVLSSRIRAAANEGRVVEDDATITTFDPDEVETYRPSFGVTLDGAWKYVPEDSNNGFALTVGGGYAGGKVDFVNWHLTPSWTYDANRFGMLAGAGVAGAHYGIDNAFGDHFEIGASVNAQLQGHVSGLVSLFAGVRVFLPMTERFGTVDFHAQAGVAFTLGSTKGSTNDVSSSDSTEASSALADSLANLGGIATSPITQHLLIAHTLRSRITHIANGKAYAGTYQHIREIRRIERQGAEERAIKAALREKLDLFVEVSGQLMLWLKGSSEANFKLQHQVPTLKQMQSRLKQHTQFTTSTPPPAGVDASTLKFGKELRIDGERLPHLVLEHYTPWMRTQIDDIYAHIRKLPGIITTAAELESSDGEDPSGAIHNALLTPYRNDAQYLARRLHNIAELATTAQQYASKANRPELKQLEQRAQCMLTGEAAICPKDHRPTESIPGILSFIDALTKQPES